MNSALIEQVQAEVGSIPTLAEQIQQIGKKCTWKEFEATEDGHLVICDPEISKAPYDFYMRVGLHLGMPTQAIMSCGKFIMMRRHKFTTVLQNIDITFQRSHLKKIDLKDPLSTLYPYQWHQVPINTSYQQTAYSKYQQIAYSNALQAQQSVYDQSGYYVNQPTLTYHWNPERALNSGGLNPYVQYVPTVGTITAGYASGSGGNWATSIGSGGSGNATTSHTYTAPASGSWGWLSGIFVCSKI